MARSRSGGPATGGSTAGVDAGTRVHAPSVACTRPAAAPNAVKPFSNARPRTPVLPAKSHPQRKDERSSRQRFWQLVVYRADGAAEAGRSRLLDRPPGEERRDGRLQVGAIVGIVRVLEVVDGAAVEQRARPVDEVGARRLLGLERRGRGTVGAVQDGEAEPALGG